MNIDVAGGRLFARTPRTPRCPPLRIHCRPVADGRAGGDRQAQPARPRRHRHPPFGVRRGGRDGEEPVPTRNAVPQPDQGGLRGRAAAGEQPAAHCPADLGYEYSAVMDDRTRETRGARRVAPQGRPVLVEVHPSVGLGCRCSTIEILVDDPDLANDSRRSIARRRTEGFLSTQ